MGHNRNTISDDGEGRSNRNCQRVPKLIYEDDVASVYLTSDVKAALREFLGRYPLSCKEPVQLHWNKSDTAHYAVVAVGFRELGVDIEYMRDRRFGDISRRYFHKDEETVNINIFYDFWCQKEAYTKWKKGKISQYMSQRIEKDMIELDLPDNLKGYLCY